MSFKKNFRGATTYAHPATDKYRDEYDRIFDKHDHVWGAAGPSKHFKEVQLCISCGNYRVWSLGGWDEITASELETLERSRAPL